jgi:hypothetical protein
MGFTPTRAIYDMDFDTKMLQGLEVRVRSVSLGEYLAVLGARRLADLPKRAWTDQDAQAIRGLYEAFAGALVAWNVEEEDGTPVPTTKDAVFAQDVTFMIPVGLAWVNAMGGGVTEDSDLGKDSPSGERFPEASLPMEALSTSPQS